MCAQLLSFVLLFAVPWTAAHQAPLSMGFPRQEHSSGLSFPTPGDLPDPEIKLATSAGSSKKQESSRKTSISALLTMPKPLTVWITINSGEF